MEYPSYTGIFVRGARRSSVRQGKGAGLAFNIDTKAGGAVQDPPRLLRSIGACERTTGP